MGLHVAIIDDDPAYRLLLETTLDDLDEVGKTSSFGAAEAFLDAAPEAGFDLVLLDLGLPGMGGLECLQRLHEVSPGLPVVVLSNSTHQPDIDHAYEQGARGYLVKPGELDELEDLLEDLVTMWERMARPAAKAVTKARHPR